MSNFNVDLAIEYVKKINENTQCITCDKFSGPCVRYTCGHWICKHCADRTGECLSCIYPTVSSYSEDKPLTQRANNACDLFNTFQDVFKIDVNRRQRISDQLKLEKKLFPDCIQAVCKYSNKRKISNISDRNKENINETVFPGEEMSYTDRTKMSKSFKYVQNWLNQQENVQQNIPRKPFGDININNQSTNQKRNEDVAKFKKLNNSRSNDKSSTYRVRSHFKTLNKTQSSLNKSNFGTKERKKYWKYEKCDRNESGIVIDDIDDDNDPIVIDDAKMHTVDKDKLAWMAVIAEDEKDPYVEESDLSHCTLHNTHSEKEGKMIGSDKMTNIIKNTQIKNTISKKVPFYKKSLLFETCKQCRLFINSKKEYILYEENKNDVSIVINNASFVTTINFNNCIPSNSNILHKKSVAIQTNTNDYYDSNTVHQKNTTNQKRKILLDHEMFPAKPTYNDGIQSQNLFTEKTTEGVLLTCKDIITQNICNAAMHNKCLIIEESDSDSNESLNNTYEVVVDVHKSSEHENVDYGILKTLSRCDYRPRSKRTMRHHTPNSTDSSDKENVDPNRIKTPRFGKKKKRKNDFF